MNFEGRARVEASLLVIVIEFHCESPRPRSSQFLLMVTDELFDFEGAFRIRILYYFTDLKLQILYSDVHAHAHEACLHVTGVEY